MDSSFGDQIWQRGSAKKIMFAARRSFRNTIFSDPTAAEVSLASTHYSLVKRYANGLFWPLALWHMWRALVRARIAVVRGLKSFDQMDVVTRILSRGWTRDVKRAKKILEQALAYSAPSESSEMRPHTRALVLITLGDLEFRGENEIKARHLYDDAYKLIPEIEKDRVSLDQDRQLVRVMKAIGFFFYDLSEKDSRLRTWARELLAKALSLALEVSRDQAVHISAELQKREHS